jgi:hypothetical protein
MHPQTFCFIRAFQYDDICVNCMLCVDIAVTSYKGQLETVPRHVVRRNMSLCYYVNETILYFILSL